MTEPEENCIPFIHNYCDRWCERCEFTARCRVYAMEAEMSDEEKDIESGGFARTISRIFDDARVMLKQKAEEFGIEIDETETSGYLESRELKREMVRSDELAELAAAYARSGRQILGSNIDSLTERTDEDQAIGDMVQILYWYLFFISAKIQRGLDGIIDEDGNDDPEQLQDSQSDANGSIKIALIAIERSILAWTYVLPDENAEDFRSMIDLLEKIRTMTENKFPIARDFIRPGFDECEMVM